MTTTPALLDISGLTAGSTSQKPEKLHSAAEQFEALLVGEMLKSARESASDDDSLGGGGDSGGDAAMEMAESQLATAMSTGKGLGLAKMIERSVGQQLSGKADAQNVAEKPAAASGASTKKL